MLSGRDLCDELITRPEESYRLWWVVVCDLETSRTRRSWPALGCSATEFKKSHRLLSDVTQVRCKGPANFGISDLCKKRTGGKAVLLLWL